MIVYFKNTINLNKKKHNINDINIQKLKTEELLYLSNCWNAYKNGYLFKIYQITNYGWLEDKKLDECIIRLTELNISKNSLFEYNLEIENELELLNRKLIGYIDCIDKEKNIVYEFKCVQKLEKEHHLQLALYMYMYELEKIKHIKNEFNKNKDILNKKIDMNNKKLIDLNENKDKIINKTIIDLLHMKERLNKKIDMNNKKLIDLNENKDKIFNKTTIDLSHIKERLNKKIDINNKKLIDLNSNKNEIINKTNIDYKNNIVCDKTNEYSVGDIIKFKLFNEEIGEIVKIYKTTGKIKVKNSNNKNIDIPKTRITSVIKYIDITKNIKPLVIKYIDNNYNKVKINDIENDLCKLNNEVIDINKLIDESRQSELLKLPIEINNIENDLCKLNNEQLTQKLYSKETKYVLFNILTNEYIDIKCEFQKLKKMIEYLIYSKYINDKPITNEDFIKFNIIIYSKYYN